MSNFDAFKDFTGMNDVRELSDNEAEKCSGGQYYKVQLLNEGEVVGNLRIREKGGYDFRETYFDNDNLGVVADAIRIESPEGEERPGNSRNYRITVEDIHSREAQSKFTYNIASNGTTAINPIFVSKLTTNITS